MPVYDLSGGEQRLVLKCIQFLLHGGRFDLNDIEFRMGLSEEELRGIEQRWSEIDDRDQNGVEFLAVNNALNEVCHGPDAPSEGEWKSFFCSSPDEVEAVYTKWARSHGLTWTGIR